MSGRSPSVPEDTDEGMDTEDMYDDESDIETVERVDTIFRTEEYTGAVEEMALAQRFAANIVAEYRARGGLNIDIEDFIQIKFLQEKRSFNDAYRIKYREVLDKVNKKAKRYAEEKYGTDDWWSVPGLGYAFHQYKVRKLNEMYDLHAKQFWTSMYNVLKEGGMYHTFSESKQEIRATIASIEKLLQEQEEEEDFQGMERSELFLRICRTLYASAR